MRWLLFLSRVAFICNLFSVLTILVLWKNVIDQQVIVSTIGVIGYVLAIIFNPIVNLIYLILLLFKRSKLFLVPRWLMIANFVFLLLQLQYIFFINDTIHN